MMKYFGLAVPAMLAAAVHSAEMLDVCKEKSKCTSKEVLLYSSEAEFANKLLPIGKVHNLTNNIKKEKTNLEAENEDMDKVDCVVKFNCYFNSVIQALHASPSIVKLVNELSENTNQKDWYVSKYIKAIFNGIEDGSLTAHISGAEYGKSIPDQEEQIQDKAETYVKAVQQLADALKENGIEKEIQDERELVEDAGEALTDERVAEIRGGYKLSVPLGQNKRGNLKLMLGTLLDSLVFEAKDVGIDAPLGFYLRNILNCKGGHSYQWTGETKNVLDVREKYGTLESNIKKQFSEEHKIEIPCTKCENTDGNNEIFDIEKLPIVMIFQVQGEEDYPTIAASETLKLRDIDGIKTYKLVSTVETTYYDDPQKGHAVASVKLNDGSWRELNDLLKDGVAPQGIAKEFETLPSPEKKRFREVLFYEQM